MKTNLICILRHGNLRAACKTAQRKPGPQSHRRPPDIHAKNPMKRATPFFLSAVLLAGCATSVPRLEVAERRAMGVHYCRAGVTGSMFPYIRGNDMILIVPTPYEELRQGMPVIFWAEWRGQVIIHRLARKLSGGCWATRGDNNVTDDPWYLTSKTYIGTWCAITELSRDVRETGRSSKHAMQILAVPETVIEKP